MRNKREHIRRAIVLILAVASLIIRTVAFSPSSGLAYAQAAAPSWSYTGSLNTGRAWHTATLLFNGKVLVVGGSIANRVLDSAELYDPATGTWSFTGSLNVARWGHTATLLPNGKVLIAGGSDAKGLLASAEIYDTATGIFTAIANMTEAQSYHTATFLTSGKVLITGGYDGSADLAADPELYDPATGTFVSTGNYADTGAGSVYRMAGLVGVPATLLPNGKVLIVAEPRAELYDPVSGTFSLTGANTFGRTATLLRSGKVLVTGGEHEDLGRFSTAELYDPSTGTFTATSDMTRARDLHTATLLPDGRVLITGGDTEERFNGGWSYAGSTASAEIFDPATGTFSSVDDMTARRALHTATLLNNGRVLITGGAWSAGIGSFMGMLATAELYNPGISAGSNPIDDAQFFVRQQYLDFLNREPDANGLAFWTDQINSCGGDPQCVEVKRINVSAAYFLSIEFQQTGYLVYRTYKASYGNLSDTPVPVRFTEFLPDTQQIGHGIVVNQPGWESLLENNKQAFMTDFLKRARFIASYPVSLTPTQFVDALFANAGVTPSETDRTSAINEFGPATITSDAAARARALRRVAENSALQQQEFNRAFVLMQYFGYLRRNPNDAPDSNFDGYNFWLNKLDSFNGDFAQAEMVKAFINSAEYRKRFGP